MSYIYVREHESYDIFNAYKLGKTENIIDRDNFYIKNEIKKGKFIIIIKIDEDLLDITFSKLTLYLKLLGYHIYRNGGIHFYNKEIKNKIIPYLDNKNIKYEILYNESK